MSIAHIKLRGGLFDGESRNRDHNRNKECPLSLNVRDPKTGEWALGVYKRTGEGTGDEGDPFIMEWMDLSNGRRK